MVFVVLSLRCRRQLHLRNPLLLRTWLVRSQAVMGNGRAGIRTGAAARTLPLCCPGMRNFFALFHFFVILVTRMISGKCKKCRILTTRRKLFGNISLCCTLKIEKVEASLLVMHKWISLAAEATFQVQGLQCNCLIGLGYQVSSGAILKITASA